MVGFTWGLLPQMLGKLTKPRSGTLLLAVVVGLVGVVSVARNRGLITWSTEALVRSQLADKWMHMVLGFMLTMLLAWLFGARRVWLGLVGIVIAAAMGGMGEVLQFVFRKPMDMRDWMAHLMGSAAAVTPYLLCMAARWCESADVHEPSPEAQQAYSDAF